ncbi:subtilisin-like serine protease [Arthrobotrys musiformis]|uniref:Subtilisin-like serine protease n=1 Tax=Arthrobotrys musiformis TaxID=47236 RepID=A0AAV9WDW5_9PEZI
MTKSSVVPESLGDGFLDLEVLSQPPRASIEDLGGSFWNYEGRGKDQVVYVMDSGCDMNHPEVRNVKFRKDWIFGGTILQGDEKVDALDYIHYKHGTPVTGKIAGERTGVAQEAEIVVVKMTDGRGSINHDTIINSFVKVYDDILKNPGRNCIINFSSGWYHPNDRRYAWNDKAAALHEFHIAYNRLAMDVLKKLLDLPNVVLVAPVDNDTPGAPIYVYPARFGNLDEFENKIVVVGGYDPRTGYVSNPWDDYVRVAAFYIDGGLAVEYPAYPPKPTERQKRLQLESADGSSFVTGVIATILGTGISMADAIPYLYSQAYPRVEGGPNVVYNGIQIGQWTQNLWPAWYSPSPRVTNTPVKTIFRNGVALKTVYSTILGPSPRPVAKRTADVGGSSELP